MSEKISLNEFISRLEALQKAIIEQAPNMNKEIALSGKALVVNRIQSKGVVDREYSDNALPSFFLLNSAINERGKKYVRDKQKKKEPASYKGLREAEGLQTKVIDLTHSGKMWQGTGITEQNSNGLVFRTVIGGTNKESADKLEWNTEQFEEVLSVKKDEKQILLKIADSTIDKIIKQVRLK